MRKIRPDETTIGNLLDFLKQDAEPARVKKIDERGQVDLSAHDARALRGELGPLARKAAQDRRRCESGWTGDCCTKPLGHRGEHSNERRPR